MSRGRRFAVQLILLPLLWLLASVNFSWFQVVVGASLIVSLPAALGIAGALVYLTRLADRTPDPLTGESGAPESMVREADQAVTVALILSGCILAGALAIGRAIPAIKALLELAPEFARASIIGLGWALFLVLFLVWPWFRDLKDKWLPMIASRITGRD